MIAPEQLRLAYRCTAAVAEERMWLEIGCGRDSAAGLVFSSETPPNKSLRAACSMQAYTSSQDNACVRWRALLLHNTYPSPVGSAPLHCRRTPTAWTTLLRLAPAASLIRPCTRLNHRMHAALLLNADVHQQPG